MPVGVGDGTVNLQRPAAAVAAMLPAASIPTLALQDSAVTTLKLAAANVTTAKLADAAVTVAKLASTPICAVLACQGLGAPGTATLTGAKAGQKIIAAIPIDHTTHIPTGGGGNVVLFQPALAAYWGTTIPADNQIAQVGGSGDQSGDDFIFFLGAAT